MYDVVTTENVRSRVTVWVSRAGQDRVKAMAAGRSTDETTIKPAAVYREVLAAGLRALAADCAAGHRGPIRSGGCGHCGRTV